MANIIFLFNIMSLKESNQLKYLDSIIWKKVYSIDEVPMIVDLQCIIYMKP